MVSRDTVFNDIWPVVEGLIAATLEEDDAGVRRRLDPRGPAAVMHTLFGVPVFDILLKTVLGRDRLALIRAIETDNGRHVHVEFVWPEPGTDGAAYTAADIVSAQLGRYRKGWRVISVNPATSDLPLTEPRAQGILTTSKVLTDEGGVPQEPWILPVALYAGALQIPLRPEAMGDAVEALLLPGLQHRTFGILSLVNGRRLWRDFIKKAHPDMDNPAAWAAAVEFIIAEQNSREPTQATVAESYEQSLTALLSRIRTIKNALNIQGIDERYSALQRTQIVFDNRTE